MVFAQGREGIQEIKERSKKGTSYVVSRQSVYIKASREVTTTYRERNKLLSGKHLLKNGMEAV